MLLCINYWVHERDVIFHKRVRVFYQGSRVSKHARTMEFTRLFTKQFLLFSRICETRKTMKTRGRNGRVVFIVLSVLQIQENNEYRLVNSRVNSIVLKYLETLVEHEPRVYEMTSQSTIVYCFSIR